MGISLMLDIFEGYGNKQNVEYVKMRLTHIFY